jgi:hypothetical protein
MANTTFDFEYDLPDEYLHQTADKKLKAKFTYTGPEKIWITVDKTTGQLEFSSGFYADDGSKELEDFVNTLAGQARKAILLDAKKEPVIASIFVDRRPQSDFPQKEYRLPGDDTVYYTRSDPTLPDHTYEVAEIKYDLASNKWVKPFPWKKPHITREQFEHARTSIIESAERDIADPKTSEELKKKLKAYKAELEAVPTKFAGWDVWQIPFPADPRAEPIEVLEDSK